MVSISSKEVFADKAADFGRLEFPATPDVWMHFVLFTSGYVANSNVDGYLFDITLDSNHYARINIQDGALRAQSSTSGGTSTGRKLALALRHVFAGGRP